MYEQGNGKVMHVCRSTEHMKLKSKYSDNQSIFRCPFFTCLFSDAAFSVNYRELCASGTA